MARPTNMPILHNTKIVRLLCIASLLLPGYAATAGKASAQERTEAAAPADPASTLTSLLSAACRQNQAQFINYLTAANVKAFQNLSDDSRAAVVKRFSLSDAVGRPLLSSDADGHPVMRCEIPGVTTEFHFGAVRVEDNLAFIPVEISNGPAPTQFGLIRQSGSWKLLSLGLMLFDIPQLAAQWSAQDLGEREKAVVQTLSALADVVRQYRTIFGKLPDTLAQLGPAGKEGVSADAAQLLNAQIAGGSLDGYKYQYRLVQGSAPATSVFELIALPEQYGKTGRRSFLMDTAGKVHGADKKGKVATAQDPSVDTTGADDAEATKP
jgi:hypothetical protein